ncbi:hypothetical protein BCR36DRAFT_357920 [Piromyces finnis]|uniref:Uncharacterized protein n=1 Tax=Piromyces finnis TaxID=1754191 RepID=A0A1Y1V2E9_9FUNG|nr:hypothetical protein BCR36DRAFT_357920 [Piromyces finnis]|eukprot:ORX45783.1 hypothetical protein BCR36DRAFT_357920 [Piromyces finnis]
MDNILKYCIPEISLEGGRGCTIKRFWHLLSKKCKEENENFTGIDKYMKNYLWTYVLQLKELAFHLADKDKEYEEIPLNIVSKETLESLNEKYGESFRIYVKNEYRKKHIIGSEDILCSRISNSQYLVLEAIAKNRSKGITQNDIAKKLDMDPRSLFHCLKILMDFKLIVKYPVVSKGIFTNLCILIRYALKNPSYLEYRNRNEKMFNKYHLLDESNNKGDPTKDSNEDDDMISVNSALVKIKITEILNSALNNILSATNLQTALGFYNCTLNQRKWFNRTLSLLCEKKYIEKIMVKKENRAPERCYKLLKMYTISRPQSHIDNVKDIDLQNNRKVDVIGEGGILVDLPLEYQVYRIIALSGEKGITANNIRNSLSFVGTRVLVRALEKLVRPSKAPKDIIGINRIAEFVGKERHYRYFAAGSFENFLRKSRNDLISDREIEKMVTTNNLISRKKSKRKPKTDKNEEQTTNTNNKDEEKNDNNDKNDKNDNINNESSVSTVNNQSSLEDSNSLSLQQTSLNDINNKELDSKVKTENILDEYIIQNKDFLNKYTQGKKNKIVSLTELRRRQYIIDRLEKENIIEINSILLNDLDEYEQNFSDNNHKIDKKTILRMVRVLEKEEALKILVVQLPTLYGEFINKTLILHQKVPTDSEEVKHFIDSMRDKNVLNTGKLKQHKVKFADSIEMENLDDLKKRIQFQQKPGTNKDNNQKLKSTMDDESKEKEESTNKENKENHEEENNNSSSNTTSSTKIKSENQSNTILWNCIAQNYGWITAKMIRVKILHLHILKCILKSKNLNELDKSQKYYPFETTLIIKEMTLDLYLKIIGQLSVSPELDNFLRIPDSKKRTILELPKNIRYIFFGGKMRFRRILKTTLEILIALKLIKPINEKGEEIEVNNQHYVPQDTLCHQYNFYISVPLYDYAIRELTFIKRFNIYNFDELNNYWIQLQCICQQRDPDIFSKNLETTTENKNTNEEKSGEEPVSSTEGDKTKENHEENHLEELTNDEENDNDKTNLSRKRIHYSKTVFEASHPLAYLTNIRNWQISISCTASQKLILDTYINKQKGITPLNNNALCKEIAAKIGVSEIRVKSYFTRYELKYRKKKLSLINYRNGVSHKGSRRNRSRIKKTRKMGSSSIPSGNSSNYGNGSNHSLSSSCNKDSNELMRGRPSFRDNILDHSSFKTGIKRKNSYSNKYTQSYNDNDLNSLPVIGDIEKYKSQYEANNKRKRPNWTASEDEILIHAYVISKHRADKAKLLWTPISLLFPNRTRELCRRRINVLLKNIYIQEKIRQLYIQWKSIYSIQLKKNKQKDEYQQHSTILNSIESVDTKDTTTIITPENPLIDTNAEAISAITVASTTATSDTSVTTVIETEATTSVMEVDDTNQSMTTQSTQPNTENITNINDNSVESNPISPISPATLKDSDDYLDLQLNKDLSDINLKPLVDYFMKHVNIQEPTKIADKYIPLPDSIQQVQALFNIKSTVSSYNDSETCLEDILEELSSLRAKLYALYCRPLTVNAFKQDIIDNCINEDNLMMMDNEESEKIKALIKMILMTPKEQYSSTQAFSVLNSFSQEEIILAIQKAKNESMLVKVKGFTDRRVPGRGFHLSDKFLSSLSKRLPENLIYQAALYEHDLRVALNDSPKGYVVFPPLIDGGGMASLIDLLSSGKIELKPIFKDHNKHHDFDIWIRKSDHSNELNTFKRRLTNEIDENNDDISTKENEDSSSLNKEDNEIGTSSLPGKQVKLIEDKNNKNDKLNSSNKSPKKIKKSVFSEEKSKELTKDSIKKTSSVQEKPGTDEKNSTKQAVPSKKEKHTFTGSSNNYQSLEERYKDFNAQDFIKKNLCHLKMFNVSTIYKIYQCIEEKKTKGITLNKIKAKLADILEDTTEFDLRTLLNQMIKCFVDKSNNISLIIPAGFKIRRYVAFKYIMPWILPQHYLEMNEEENNYVELNEFSNHKKCNPLYSPFKMWYNLDGEIVKSILKDCLETVLSCIVQNPGIYESRLFQKFSISMTKCELQDLLEMLLEKNIIRSKTIIKPKKPSIFDFDDSSNFDYIDYDGKNLNSNKITCYFPNNNWYRI